MADAVSLLLSGRSADHRLFGFKGCLAEWSLAVGVRKRRSVALLDIFFSTMLMLFNTFLQLQYHLLSCWNTVNCTRQMPHKIFSEFVCCLLLETHSSSREPTENISKEEAHSDINTDWWLNIKVDKSDYNCRVSQATYWCKGWHSVRLTNLRCWE